VGAVNPDEERRRNELFWRIIEHLSVENRTDLVNTLRAYALGPNRSPRLVGRTSVVAAIIWNYRLRRMVRQYIRNDADAKLLLDRADDTRYKVDYWMFGVLKAHVADFATQSRSAECEIRPLDRPVRMAIWCFGTIEALVPRRLRNEELGDGLEFIRDLDRPRWQRYLKISSTLFWVAINAVREVVSSALGQKKAS
jgi:hypothetical protein